VEQRTTFTLSDGEARVLPSVTLAALVHEAGVVIDSVPAGAEVRIDGQVTGQVTPARLAAVTPGMHQIQLVHQGYAPFELQALVPSDAVLHVPTAQLVAAVDAPAAPVPMAATSDAQRVEPVATHHRASSHRHPGGHSARPSVSAPHRAKVAAVAPGGGKGVLRINSRPWAQVYVDGKLMGNTPQMAIQLAPGNHKVKLVNQPMGLSKTLSVTVKNGETVTKIMNLIE
jgi:hypothetical protein